MAANTKNPESMNLMSYLRDIRVIQVIAQIVFVILVVGALALIWSNILNSLESKNLEPTFDFLSNRAGFGIAESPDWYSADATYGEAFWVGIRNTARVVVIGLAGATFLGVLVGIMLLSNNWLIKTISRVYVEVLRNTPLLVQLIFWLFVVMFNLPTNDITIPHEGVMEIPYRNIIFLLLFLGSWLYAQRSRFPSRITTGAIIAPIVMIGFYLIFGYSNDKALLFGLIGLIIIILSWFAPLEWRGMMMAIAIIPVAQVILHIALHILFLLNRIDNPQAIISEVQPAIFIGLKGFLFPTIFSTTRFAQWMIFVMLGVATAGGIWYYSGHVTETTGRPISRGWYAILAILGFAIIGWAVVGVPPGDDTITIEGDEGPVVVEVQEALDQGVLSIEQRQQVLKSPLFVELPLKNKFGRAEVGTEISLEYMALLLGLIVYTSAFIAEIVRAGIQAVPYGQVEAARALGLSGNQTLTRIVLPQALRVIIPPMGNQYLNLAKNSSLAVAVAFADTYQVGVTMMNQSGQSVTGFSLILIVYLSMSLVISAIMNLVNSRFQLVTR